MRHVRPEVLVSEPNGRSRLTLHRVGLRPARGSKGKEKKVAPKEADKEKARQKTDQGTEISSQIKCARRSTKQA